MERLQTWWVTELYPSKDEDNFGIAGDCEVVKFTDAQAIIAALQSEVKDLKEWLAAYKQSLELAQSSLTQRTAERDTARRRVDELEAREVDVVLLREDLEQRTAELEAANDKVQFLEKKNRNLLDSENLTLKVKADQDVRLASLQAELERVRGELVETSLYLQQERANRDSLAACVDRDVKTIKELRTLIAALPKVEGEISERFCTGSYYSSPYDYRSHVTFETALVALLKHRQGME